MSEPKTLEDRRHYVYALSDSATPNKPFYVGKGCGDRMHQHEASAMLGVRGAKCNLIRVIKDAGRHVVTKKLAENLTSDEAYALEDQVIEIIGLENLTNVIPGGGGIPSWVKIKAKQYPGLDSGGKFPENEAGRVAGMVYMLPRYASQKCLGRTISCIGIRWAIRDWGVDRFERIMLEFGIKVQAIGVNVSDLFQGPPLAYEGGLLTEKNNAIC